MKQNVAYTTEHYSTFKKGILTHVTTWMNLANTAK